MKVDKLSDQEKSVMLLKLIGYMYSGSWLVHKGNKTGNALMAFYGDIKASWGKDEDGEQWPNIYEPNNMALAWHVLNWAGSDLGGTENRIKFHDWFYSAGHDAPLWECLKPAEAQRAWLDKVLQIAIEAGMVLK